MTEVAPYLPSGHYMFRTDHGAVCKTCGREWRVTGQGDKLKATGFIVAAAASHGFKCSSLTPAQRRARDDVDAARWARDPPKNRIILNPQHPGMRGPE